MKIGIHTQNKIPTRKTSKQHSLLPLFIVNCSLLIVLCSCPAPFKTSSGPEAPEGFGIFSLSINAGRTIMPDVPALDEFAVFELIFDETTGGEDYTERFSAAASHTVTLAVGTYDITLNAYLEGPIATPTRLAASGTLTGIEIKSGAMVSETITLAILDSGGTGTFDWSVDITASGVTSAQMTIMQDGTPIGSSPTLNLSGETKGSPTLDSGVYNVRFTLIKENVTGAKWEAVWDELLYIYGGLTSSFSITFDDDYFFRTHYTVTFDNGVTIDGPQSVEHGGKLAAKTPLSREYIPEAGLFSSVPDAYVFEGWYNGVTEWDFNKPVYGDMTLTAKWFVPGLIPYDEVPANDVAEAIGYVNTNADDGDECILLLDSATDISTTTQTIDTAGFNLTIQGLGSSETIIQLSGAGPLFIINNATASLTLGENITLNGIPAGASALARVTNGTLLMKDGSKITGHTNTSSSGGGVSVEGNGTFTMEGGEVSSNKANSGGGVYVAGGTFRVGGTAKVSDNIVSPDDTTKSNVYLADGSFITLGAGGNGAPVPAPGMEIWVQPAAASGVIVNDGANEVIAGYFHADENGKAVALNDDPSHSDQLVIVDNSSLLTDFYTQVAAYGGATSDVTIYLYDDLTLNTRVEVPTPTNTNATLTIRSANPSYPRTLFRGFEDTTNNNGLFVVPNGAKLVFEDVVIDGKKETYTGNAASLVRVNGGTLTLGSGAVLKNNRASDGGGVYVTGSGALNMNGGIIGGDTEADGNTATTRGGGVYVTGSGSTFTMTGGKVSGNTAPNGGGVYVADSGSFTMSGDAEVSGNEATSNGGGVIVNGSTFTMNGGAVSGNTCSTDGGGVLVNFSATFTMKDGEVSGNSATGSGSGGGGVYLDSGPFTMSGGTVSGNTATGYGGGVYVRQDANCTFTMSGGEVSGNSATNGGGVYVTGNTSYPTGGTFIMTGGAIGGGTVSGNTATNGGGVYVTGGRFTMEGGAVSSNILIANNTKGGGVYVTNGTFNMTGGVIGGIGTGNRAYDGGGVYVTGASSTFTISGGTVSGNNGIYGGGVNYSGTGASTFTMSGGVVSGNNGTYGGGMYVNVNITMSGGTVSGNKASIGGGVWVNYGTYTMSGDAKITDNNEATTMAGGIYINGVSTFIMDGGEVSGNTTTASSSSRGGGVYVANGGAFIMNSGEVSGNTANCSINDNINNNRNGYGGGVYVTGASNTGAGSTFTMNGGKVSGNTASSVNSSGYGGGVYVSEGTFTMNGGEVSGNTTSGVTTTSSYGGGVGVNSNATFRIVTGSVYGTGESDSNLRNTANQGAALYNSGTAEYGTFVSDTWVKTTDGILDGVLSTTNNTIRVINGALVDAIFTNAADFTTWLADQQPNSSSNPYKVKLNVSDLGGVGTALSANNTKYVSLDLSGSTGVTEIASNAFLSCTGLTGISIPENVASIGAGAFTGCNNLTDITINTDKVTSINGATIPENTFNMGLQLATIFPADGLSVTFNANIGNFAFFKCDRLTSITIAEGVTRIGSSAFEQCVNLASVSISASVTTIVNNAFYTCDSLVSVTFEGTIPSSEFSNASGFPGDLRAKFYATDTANGTPGTYTRASTSATAWTKQP